MVDVRITGSEQLGDLAKRLKGAGDQGKGLRKELLKAIRTAARPALQDTRRAVRTIPVTGSRGGGRKQRETKAFRDRFDRVLDRASDDELGSDELEAQEAKIQDRARRGSGLRDTIARSLRLVTKTGSRSARVRIEVDASKMPQDQRTLPRHLDSEKGWRHPVFGNRKKWVHQRGQPWFEVTIRRHAPKVRNDILKAMDDIADKIEG
ncbi:hypothetical protein [Thermoactinospora rubra]|uniref:hypothetical protein n=1 Tax=Thermoactinospora rubra TaxID=1088767 RepID=UPI000A1099CE|nr:hypothetical protein [Thermoactinospora rubra]